VTETAAPVLPATPSDRNTTAWPSAPSAKEAEHAVLLLREMLRIRRFEERCGDLYKTEQIRGFLHLYLGEEAVAVGVMQALGPTDAIVATYREHGHALARGITMNSVMAEMFGKSQGASGGRGGSMHIFDKATRFYGGNAIVGGGLPLAIGLALADKLQGRDSVTACFFGDGAVAEGEFHESMNLAALWHLPVLFCCENNLYAMGTALARSHAETNLSMRASSYRVLSGAVDGMDVLAVERAARQAVASIRAGAGPHFLELQTYRFRPHSMFDPELYRAREEVEVWKGRCPVATLTARLRASGSIDDDTVARMESEIATEIDGAVAFAESSPWEPAATLTRFVYSEKAAP
jgi:pyruvate dehydrogenase E1 component alpha subunit